MEGRWHQNTPSRPGASTRSLVLVGAFVALGLVGIAHHELWRDELEYWDLARTSHSLGELRESARYIGQPPLWTLCLYGVTRLTHDPRAMQLLNLAFVTAAIALIARRAPFSTPQKWLLAFGYFPFFEYGLIARPYGLGLLALVAWCASRGAASRHGLRDGACLALLALAHFHATLVALAALLALVAEYGLGRSRPGTRDGAGALLAAAAIGLAVLFSVPPADSYFLQPFRFALDGERFLRSAAHLWRGYAPWPPWIDTFWNRNLLDDLPALEMTLGLALAAAFGWALRREREALLFFVASTAGLLLFYYSQRLGQTRHDGTFFLVLVAALWLASVRPDGLPGWAARLFTAVLAIQLGAAVIASVQDFRLPFSRSDAVARTLQTPELAALPLVGDVDFAAAAVAARLERPIYMVSTDRFQTRVVWNTERRRVERHDLVLAVKRVQRRSGQDVVLVLNYALGPETRFEPLGCYEGAIVANETYCLYRARARQANVAPGEP